MKPQMNADGHRLHPDAMSTWEFLNEQCFARALKGSYQQEFNAVKERLSCLKPFQTVPEFMKTLWNDKPLRENITGQLKRLWLADYDFRPNSGLILVLSMWRNAVAAGDDFWSDLFIKLAENATTHSWRHWRHPLRRSL